MERGQQSWGGPEPLRELGRWFEEARQLTGVTQESEEPGAGDPLERVGALIDQARRESRGAGGEAMQRLAARIEQARELPEPLSYLRDREDPLRVLMDRISRGIEGGSPPQQASLPERSSVSELSPSLEAGASGQLVGATLLRSLRDRPLPGPARARAVELVASLMEGSQRAAMEELWALLVFGESSE